MCARSTSSSDRYRVRSFLGLSGYYRKCIPNCATIAPPLTNLRKKWQHTKVVWPEAADRAFKELKAMLCSLPILKLSDFYRSFVLRTYASDKGIGAVLLKEYDRKHFPLSYASKKLNPTQAAYAIVERKCFAIGWALEKFTTYLYGRIFVIQTDHQPLAFLRTTRLTNPRLIR